MNNNFYLINKPLGISSFDIIRQLRKKLNIRKMGHTGTLDPLATGCMLIATGSYTKLIPYLEKSRKTYEYRVEINGETSSGDLAEDIEYISEEQQKNLKLNLSLEEVEALITEKFTGEITQRPPQFSALKIDGKRAYELARKGVEVEMKLRNLSVFSHEVLAFSYPSLDLRVELSAGAYVRSLAIDIGRELGGGGYVSVLKRTAIGKLDISQAINIDEVLTKGPINVNELFDEDRYLTNLGEYDKKRLSQGLPRIGKFELELNTPYFIFDGEAITHIVEYDGTELKPLKNIN